MSTMENNAPQLTAKEVRQLEVDSYKANIAIYKALLANLDGNWDSDLVQFKGLEGQEAARQCSMDRLERLAVLIQFEQVTNLLKTEMLECFKAQSILDVL